MNVSRFVKPMFFSILFLLSGCSTIIRGSQTTISVRSDYPDAKIYVSSDGGNTSEFYGTGCSKVSLNRSRLSSVRLIAKKKGCEDGIKTILTNVDGLIFVNLLFPIGFVIDLVTGAYNLPTSNVYVVNPVCPSYIKKKTISS